MPRRSALMDGGFAALSVVLTVLSLVAPEVVGVDPPVAGSRWWVLPLLLVPAVALLWRRSRPLLVVAGVWVPIMVHALVTGRGAEGLFLVWPTWVSLYALAAYGTRRQLWSGLALALGSLAVHDWADPVAWRGGGAAAWSAAWWDLLLVVAPLVGGLVAGTRRVRALAAERALSEARARADLAEERSRIARELHDVVTHHVNVVVLQAMAGAGLLDQQPERTREALSVIERSGREALTEMRRLLGVLRDEETHDPMAPQPGVDDVDALVESARGSGIAVDVAVTGEPRRLPTGLGLAAYRIIQEALTNAARHAAGSRVGISLCYDREVLDVRVVDDGGAPGARAADSLPSGGRGLVGMRERAALYGGTLEAGPTGDGRAGGFAVHARLPAPMEEL